MIKSYSTYPNFNGSAVEVKAWMSNYIPCKIMYVITLVFELIKAKFIDAYEWLSSNELMRKIS